MMRRFFLGAALIMAVSGCSSTAQPSGDTPSLLPAQTQKETSDPGASAAAVALPQESIKPAKPTEAGSTTEPGNSGKAASQAAQPGAVRPGVNQSEPSSIGMLSAPVSSASAQPSAVAEVPKQPAPQGPVSTPVPEKNALQISITGNKQTGVILKEVSVSFQDGISVMDVLKQVTKANKIQMEYQGKGAYAYVQGIDNLYEFDDGPKSGWVYKINGQAPGEGAGSYKVTAGDKIEWLFSLDLGADVGAKMK